MHIGLQITQINMSVSICMAKFAIWSQTFHACHIAHWYSVWCLFMGRNDIPIAQISVYYFGVGS